MDGLPTWLFYLGACVLGLELGGGATIFIQRWIDEVPILRPGRSRCPACEQKLGLLDTIPIISFILLKGRCRHCGSPIGAQYMLVEIACMAWSLAAAHHYGLSLDYAFYLVLGVMLITGSFIDFETFLLPNRITIGGMVVALGASFLWNQGPLWQNAFAGAGVGYGLFWILQRGYRLVRGQEGLGSGDVKLMGMIGAMTGLSGLPLTILIGSLSGAVASVYYMIRPAKDGIAGRIPFGPFLSLGCLVNLLYGREIIRWWGA